MVKTRSKYALVKNKSYHLRTECACTGEEYGHIYLIWEAMGALEYLCAGGQSRAGWCCKNVDLATHTGCWGYYCRGAITAGRSNNRGRRWHPTPVFLPGKFLGRRSLVGCTTQRLPFHFSLSCIGEGNGNPLQCSCLENPGMGEPGGLPSMGGVAQSQTWLNRLSSSGSRANNYEARRATLDMVDSI